VSYAVLAPPQLSLCSLQKDAAAREKEGCRHSPSASTLPNRTAPFLRGAEHTSGSRVGRLRT